MSWFGPPELLLIFGMIVLLFGATKLPELARSMGLSMGEFKVGQMEAEKRYEALKNQPLQPPQSPDDIALTRAQRMAKNLNIDIKGKTDEQLLAEIEKKLNEQDVGAKK